MLSPVFASAEAHDPTAAFFDPWDTDTHENAFVYPSTHEEPIFSFSSDFTPKTNTSSSGSDTGGPVVVNPIDERKQRRMISNRESARRSRMRKQKHLENLRSLVNRHKLVNRELTNRLRVMSRHEVILRQENERLRLESGMLRQRLWDLHQVMLVWQLPNQLLTSAWPCNNNNNNNNINVTSFNEQNHPAPSIIT